MFMSVAYQYSRNRTFRSNGAFKDKESDFASEAVGQIIILLNAI